MFWKSNQKEKVLWIILLLSFQRKEKEILFHLKTKKKLSDVLSDSVKSFMMIIAREYKCHVTCPQFKLLLDLSETFPLTYFI